MSQLKKLERDQKFNTDEFNKKFEEIDTNIKKPEFITEKELENINYTNEIGINIKNLFFEILEILMNKKNPIPYIIENEKRQFLFAIMVLIIGGLLLFWYNLLYQ